MSFVEKLTRRKFSLTGLALAMTIGLTGHNALSCSEAYCASSAK